MADVGAGPAMADGHGGVGSAKLGGQVSPGRVTSRPGGTVTFEPATEPTRRRKRPTLAQSSTWAGPAASGAGYGSYMGRPAAGGDGGDTGGAEDLAAFARAATATSRNRQRKRRTLTRDLLQHVSQASSRCLRVTKALRTMSNNVLTSSSGALMRDVSLTVATIDRVLASFFDDVLKQAAAAGHQTPRRSRARTGEPLSLSGLLHELSALHGSAVLHKYIPAGGLASVLYHMAAAFDATNVALDQMRKQYSVRWWTHLLAVARACVPLAVGWLTRRLLGHRFGGTVRLLLPWVTAAAAWMIVRSLADLWSAERALRQHHKQLGLLLRTWLVAVEIFKVTNNGLTSRKSWASLVRAPHDDDYDDASKSTAQLLLEATSIPQEASMWFRGNFKLWLVKRGLDIMYSAFSHAYDDKAGHIVVWKSLPWFVYYFLRPSLASETCAGLLLQPEVGFIKCVWRLLDSYASRSLLLLMPSLGTMRSVSVEGVACHAFYDGKLPGQFFGMRQGLPRAAGADTAGAGGGAAGAWPATPDGPPCLLYIHGGGFVGSSFASDARLIAGWARRAKLLVVFIHYSLAPEARYPIALDECVSVYRWLRARCSKVAVFGESAGGNLAAATTLKLRRLGATPPDGLVLAYPALNLNSTPSPSRFFHLSDPLVPTAALLPRLAQAYVPEGTYGFALEDPLMCPLFASDEELRQLPTTYIAACGCDPLLDDAVEFDTRLRRLGVVGDIQVFRNLPHGFFMLSHLLHESTAAIEQTFTWIRRSVGVDLNEDV